MPDEKKSEAGEPPVIDPEVARAGDFVLRTRMLVKLGISFEDPRLQAAVNQLGWWPQVVFELQGDEQGKPLAEVRVNEVDRVVQYELTIQGDLPADAEKRTGALIGWTQQLLGEEWSVIVQNRKKKGAKYKTIAKGERLKAFEAKPPTLSDAPFPEAVTGFRRYRTEPGRFKLPENEDLGPIIKPKQ